MSKRGRPRLAEAVMDTTIGVRMTPDLADAMYVLALRQRTDVSTLIRRYCRRLVEQELLNEISKSQKPEALST